MNDHKGIIGTITTASGAIITWLPAINEVVQILAGLVAIAVGIITFRHYYLKDKDK